MLKRKCIIDFEDDCEIKKINYNKDKNSVNIHRLTQNYNKWENLLNKHKNSVNINRLTQNPNLTMNFVENNVSLPWDWRFLMGKFNFPDTFLISNFNSGMIHIDSLCGRFGLCTTKIVSLDMIENNLDKPWHFGNCGVSHNPNLTADFIKKHPTKEWCFGDVYPELLTLDDLIEISKIKNNFFLTKYNINKLSETAPFDVINNNDWDWNWDIILNRE